MTGHLADTLKTLLTDSLPALLGGGAPPVTLSVLADAFTMDPHSAEPEAGEPRIDDQTDQLPFDPAHPAGPYSLTLPPAPGPRRVRLLTPLGDHIPLQEIEVVWDKLNSRAFSLKLRADRDLTGINGLEVLYGVVGVFTKVKAIQTFSIQLQGGNSTQLDQARDLTVAVVELNRKRIAEQGSATVHDGDYTAAVGIRNVVLLRGTDPAANTRVLEFTAEVEIKASRALAANEGAAIVSITSAGRPADPQRPVDIEIGVDA
jgi:hypothetical protein